MATLVHSLKQSSHRPLTEVMREQVEETLAKIAAKTSMPRLPFSIADIFAGRFSVDIEDNPKVMIPVRTLSFELNKMVRHMPFVPEAIGDFVRFASDLGKLVHKRHRLDQLEIFQVTKDSVSPKFVENLIKVESVYPYRGDETNIEAIKRRMEDLKIRRDHPRRLIYGLPDVYDPDGALVTIYIALTNGIISEIDPVLNATDSDYNIETAMPYSVSGWLRLDSIGTSFMYGVADKIYHEHRYVQQMVTLSPVNSLEHTVCNLPPGQQPFDKQAWLDVAISHILDLVPTKKGKWASRDFVGRVHLGNGAELVGLNHEGNPLDGKSCGFTAHYKYHSKAQGRTNREAYDGDHAARSPAMDALLKHSKRNKSEEPLICAEERRVAMDIAKRIATGGDMSIAGFVRLASELLDWRKTEPDEFYRDFPEMRPENLSLVLT